jgi:hypothetical protein
MKIRPSNAACLGFLALITLLAGCSTARPERYFGGHGNFINPKHHVPREVQRTEPWLPVF